LGSSLLGGTAKVGKLLVFFFEMEMERFFEKLVAFFGGVDESI
jgi:hypothetical protein